jgi:hypothetical protein
MMMGGDYEHTVVAQSNMTSTKVSVRVNARKVVAAAGLLLPIGADILKMTDVSSSSLELKGTGEHPRGSF